MPSKARYANSAASEEKEEVEEECLLRVLPKFSFVWALASPPRGSHGHARDERSE